MEAGWEDELAARVELLDWRRRTFALYAELRASDDPPAAWERWRSLRDELFATHACSPLAAAARAAFAGLDYFPYDRALRVEGELRPLPPRAGAPRWSGAAASARERVGEVRFVLAGAERALELEWLSGYAGGLFLAFSDATSGEETDGGGRYLLDTAKGADLGLAGGRLVLDLNFAYNPSCAYDPGWSCPLPAAANRLAAPVYAGERAPARAA